MVNQILVSYIYQNLSRGYAPDDIRSFLIKNRYNANDVNEAMNYVYTYYYKYPEKHEIHLSKSTIITIAALSIAVIILMPTLFFYFAKENPPEVISPAKLLDINLEEIKTTAIPSDSVSFLVEVTNMGSEKRYDVELRYEIINVNTNKILTFKEETRGIETLSSAKINIKIPENAELGNYILKTTAKYDSNVARAALPIKIYKEEEKPTCTDNIMNQDETGIDCGGICQQCRECPKSCDDNNPCTEDICNEQTNYGCKNELIMNCCGNKICEINENSDNCLKDCPKIDKDIFEGLSIFEKLDKIKEISKSDIDKALEHCNKIEQELYKDQCFYNVAVETNRLRICEEIKQSRQKDECYSDIAKATNNREICEKIEKSSRKDSCYMNFILAGDYSVCNRIDNDYLKQACETLREVPANQSQIT